MHDFTSNAKVCKGREKNPRLVHRYLDTSDSKLTGGLRRHAKICWGEENVARADEARNIEEACQKLKDAKLINHNCSIQMDRKRKGN